MRIALVDDDVTTNFINKSKLTKEIESCEVISFFNGKEALGYLNSGEVINVALLVMNMQVMNGLEFLKNHSKLQVKKKIEKIFFFAEQGVDKEFCKKNMNFFMC